MIEDMNSILAQFGANVLRMHIDGDEGVQLITESWSRFALTIGSLALAVELEFLPISITLEENIWRGDAEGYRGRNPGN